MTGVIDEDTDSAEPPVKSWLADDVQLLTSTEAEALKPMLSKRLYFAALPGQISRKKLREPWSPDENPAKAMSCRVLGRSQQDLRFQIICMHLPRLRSYHTSAGQPAAA